MIIYPYHIQRKTHILHPEGADLFLLENKKHALILQQTIPEHQAALPGLESFGDFRLDTDISHADFLKVILGVKLGKK